MHFDISKGPHPWNSSLDFFNFTTGFYLSSLPKLRETSANLQLLLSQENGLPGCTIHDPPSVQLGVEARGFQEASSISYMEGLIPESLDASRLGYSTASHVRTNLQISVSKVFPHSNTPWYFR